MRGNGSAVMEGGSRQRGVIHGHAFRFGASSPTLDRLSEPLTLSSLAEPRLQTLISRPEPTNLFLWLVAFLKKQRGESPTERLLRRMRDAMALVRTTMVLPPAPMDLDGGGKVKAALGGAGNGKFRRPRGLEHPYQLKTVLDLVPELPDAYSAERKYFEELLFVVDQKYKERVSQKHDWTFGFQNEALQYFQLAERMKRQMKRRSFGEDLKRIAQDTHDNYFHGIYYYMLSVYIREPCEKPNTLFLEFCAASQFLARLDWDGSLLEQPNIRRLPTRGQLLYFAIRDETVLKQFNANLDYVRRFKALLSDFPITNVRHGGDDRAEAARKGRARIKPAFLRGSAAEAAGAS